MKKTLSIRKYKKLLSEAMSRFYAQRKRLSPEEVKLYSDQICKLDGAIQSNDLTGMQNEALKVSEFLSTKGKKSIFSHIKELVVALLFALVVAAVVRQTWFELYEIPSGSMRPTFLESDRVFVEKDAFGINVPFQTKHFLFEPSLVKRGNIIVWTGDNIDLPDTNTIYFGLFPGKKRYVKRCIGKPGDILYFYGGTLYGIDKEGNAITDYEKSESLQREYIPFMSFDGRESMTHLLSSNKRVVTLRHMNVPLAQMFLSPNENVKALIPHDGTFIPENFSKDQQSYPTSFENFWGIKNYAMARLTSFDEIPHRDEKAALFLELEHNPKLCTSMQDFSDTRQSHFVRPEISYIPLGPEQIQSIKNTLYTSRFIVKNGVGHAYTQEETKHPKSGIFLDKNIPDGTYEFIDGKAYSIGFGALSKELPQEHPVYPKSLDLLKKYYNFGIDFLKINAPNFKNYMFSTHRYGYFKNGDFLTMGHILFTKNDPVLVQFCQNEIKRSQHEHKYEPFVDYGPPVKDSHIDKEFIKTFGFHVPENKYFFLGDNHSVSADSRYFGCVPQENIQGTVELIFYPPGKRWGSPEQPSIPFFRKPHMIVLFSYLVAFGIGYWYAKKNSPKRRFYKYIRSL